MFFFLVVYTASSLEPQVEDPSVSLKYNELPQGTFSDHIGFNAT